jgi:hypothetical protein
MRPAPTLRLTTSPPHHLICLGRHQGDVVRGNAQSRGLRAHLLLASIGCFEVLKEYFDFSSQCFFRRRDIPLVDDTAA